MRPVNGAFRRLAISCHRAGTICRSQSRVNKLQGRNYFRGALSGRDTAAAQKTMSGLLKLMFPDPKPTYRRRIEWSREARLECRRRVKEQQKRIGCRIPNTHFSFTRYPDGIEQFVSTPELHNENSIGSDPLQPDRCGPCLRVVPMKTRAVPY